MQSITILYGGFVKNRDTGEYEKLFETEISPLLAKNRAIEAAKNANRDQNGLYDPEDVQVMQSMVQTFSSDWEPMQKSEKTGDSKQT